MFLPSLEAAIGLNHFYNFGISSRFMTWIKANSNESQQKIQKHYTHAKIIQHKTKKGTQFTMSRNTRLLPDTKKPRKRRKP